jgi:hypothetical protein
LSAEMRMQYREYNPWPVGCEEWGFAFSGEH